MYIGCIGYSLLFLYIEVLKRKVWMLFRRLFISLLILSALTADGTVGLADYLYNLNLYSDFGLDLSDRAEGQTVCKKAVYVNRHDTVIKHTFFHTESFDKLAGISFDNSYISRCGFLYVTPAYSSNIFTEVNRTKLSEVFLLQDAKDIVLLQSDSSPPLIL